MVVAGGLNTGLAQTCLRHHPGVIATFLLTMCVSKLAAFFRYTSIVPIAAEACFMCIACVLHAHLVYSASRILMLVRTHLFLYETEAEVCTTQLWPGSH